MAKTTVLYHGPGCPDGFGASWAAWLVIGDDADYVPVQYGQPVPETPLGATVYILDFSYSREELILLAARSAFVFVLDHHRTAKSDLEGWQHGLGNLSVRFNMNQSGAVMAWVHFHPGKPIPKLLDFIQDRDLWRWSLPDSRAFSAALSVEPRDFARWSAIDCCLNGDIGREVFIQRGGAILDAIAVSVDSLSGKAVMTDIGGHVIPCVNSPLYQSEIGEKLCTLYPAAPFSGVFFIPEFGTEVWSLRSRNGFDVAAVAKSLGGGGHAAAAGFTRKTGGS